MELRSPAFPHNGAIPRQCATAQTYRHPSSGMASLLAQRAWHSSWMTPMHPTHTHHSVLGCTGCSSTFRRRRPHSPKVSNVTNFRTAPPRYQRLETHRLRWPVPADRTTPLLFQALCTRYAPGTRQADESRAGISNARPHPRGSSAYWHIPAQQPVALYFRAVSNYLIPPCAETSTCGGVRICARTWSLSHTDSTALGCCSSPALRRTTSNMSVSTSSKPFARILSRAR